ALAAGACALVVVSFLMKMLSRMNADGTARIERAVGSTGSVYLPIPAHKGGSGKVLINLQNRTVECKAVTSESALATGARIVAVAVVSGDTVEVALANERTSHV